MCRNDDDDDDGHDDDGRRAASTNGSTNNNNRLSSARSTRSGRSNRSGGGGGGGGIQFGSDDGSDDDESEFGEGPAGGMVAGGISGFGGGGFGGAGASSKRAYGGGAGGAGGRTSRRVFGARPARSSRSRSRTDFGGGGGGGAMDLLRQDSGSVVDNTPQLNASGQVIDTGIGVMPALDLARQKAGLTSTSVASTPMGGGGVGGVGGGAGGLFGDSGAGTGGSIVGAGVGVSNRLGVAAGTGEEWEEEDEFSQTPNYLRCREELDQSLGEGRGGLGRVGGVQDADGVSFSMWSGGRMVVCCCFRTTCRWGNEREALGRYYCMSVQCLPVPSTWQEVCLRTAPHQQSWAVS